MLTYISNSAHYKEVLSRVLHVKESLWIGTDPKFLRSDLTNRI